MLDDFKEKTIRSLLIDNSELRDIIENAIKFLETEYNSYPSSEEWRKALLNILKGE